MAAFADKIDSRGPKEFKGVRQAEKTQQADMSQGHPVLTKIHREIQFNYSERQPLSEI
jgi:hypothetical protein